MRSTRIALVISFLIAGTAGAQPPPVPPEPSIQGFTAHFGGGASFPVGPANSRYHVGWALTAGGGYFFTDRIGVELEYLYSSYGLQPGALPAGNLVGSHSLQYGDLNVLYNVVSPDDYPVSVYVIGGPGVYHRNVTIDRIEGVTSVFYCDPYLFFCYPEPVFVGEAIGSHSSTDFGLNVGVGVQIGELGGPYFYMEARYHYVFDHLFSSKGDGAHPQYLPLLLGIRF